METLFSLPIFFISFREALETGIIVSVLLAIVGRTLDKQDDAILYARMVRQVWLGTVVGIVVCIILGTAIIYGIYGLTGGGIGGAEDIWEAVFSLGASLVITVMGVTFVQVGKLEHKWWLKLSNAMNASNGPERSGWFMGRIGYFAEKYALFILPFITVLREGFEGIIFIAGVGIGSSPASIPLSISAGLLIGSLVSFLVYKFGGANSAQFQYFLVLSTCFLYLVAAGLFSKGIWHLEAYQWNQVVGGDAAELGSGPGSYDIRRSVWHVNCCNPDLNGGGFWGIFNAILGWQNSATIGSVLSYNLYWIAVTIGFLYMIAKEKGYISSVEAEVQPDSSSARQPLLANSTLDR